MKVIIDPGSGFCGGVIRAISRAEEFLSSHPKLHSLGEMVHNEAELVRLESKGLVSVGRDALSGLPAGESVLIRAHGEPPSTYAAASHLNIIDCTCPVVLKIQKSIREAGERLAGKGTIVIFGKIGHPEVLGLVGQAPGQAVVVVENMKQLQQAVTEARIAAPVEVFSQTTKSPVEYGQICSPRKRPSCSKPPRRRNLPPAANRASLSPSPFHPRGEARRPASAAFCVRWGLSRQARPRLSLA